jgi:hypothetical protein
VGFTGGTCKADAPQLRGPQSACSSRTPSRTCRTRAGSCGTFRTLNAISCLSNSDRSKSDRKRDKSATSPRFHDAAQLIQIALVLPDRWEPFADTPGSGFGSANGLESTYHEQSIDECAQILGIPAATVKTRMFYARKKLAELVKGA